MYKLFFKRFLDFTLTLIGFILISPIFLVLCLLVRIKLGSPIFYKQLRITKGEKPFYIIKFRTMLDDRDENGNLLPDEMRFTKFGDFLRNTSLDELPELINVLKGEMSLVGPRPLYVIYLPYYTEEESLRHDVRAGITGLAQINGRSLCKWNDRFGMDCQYVKTLSLVNDIKILWRTFFKVAAQDDIGIPSVEEELPLNIARSVIQPDKLAVVEEINSKYGKTDTYIEEIKEIGGDFFISQLNEIKPADTCNAFNERGIQFVSTCRSAIKEILIENDGFVNNKVALVPSFTCHVCVEPFVAMGYKVFPYSLEKDFSINTVQFLKEIDKHHPSFILVHSYFGFDTLKNLHTIIEDSKVRNIAIIEDLTHGMWGEFEHLNVSYHVGSIRKWLEIPDGAFVKGLKRNLSELKQDEQLVKAKVEGMVEKGKFLRQESNNSASYRKMQQESEAFLDDRMETFKMSTISSGILNNLDKDEFRKQRHDNYNKLHELLTHCESIILPLGRCNINETPFMLPVYVPEKRKELQKYMVENKIFPTIIWACPDDLKDSVDGGAQYIYDHILCFHCDQRYNQEDMERIATTINNFYFSD